MVYNIMYYYIEWKIFLPVTLQLLRLSSYKKLVNSS